ncbi:hypothetical protein BMF94_6577 [Rhodotorula taiwanensis]|uniref:HpcH/HpaI aldolase/citrate lyase domain-containing protein n=1 Tax=Rhodotorula taiwanensis TaxID=741276 RepID=A0A2S5B0X2_9BASI|nr:hypothetical protein BMF94_6577 [Rhodotorula taiwanensis]
MKSHSLLRSLLSSPSRPSSLSNPLVVRPTSLNRQRSTAATTPTRDTTRAPPPPPQRALLYVPGSNGKMLEKMVGGGTSSSATATTLLAVPDVVTLDLEDSVRIEKKAEARQLVARTLKSAPTGGRTKRFVRVNSGQRGLDDLEAILACPNLDGILLPKINSASELVAFTNFIDEHAPTEMGTSPLKVVASIESPLGLLNMREIVTASPRVGGLLFAAEDYCASSRLIRTPSRLEMLYARSSVVAVAHAYGLAAIDLVCVKYKGDDAERILREESEEGRRLGFTGKQAIHPAQVPIIQEAFAPSSVEIARARAILEQYDLGARDSGAGAYGLTGQDGTVEMIDAPMLLQAQGILEAAKAAGLA